MGASSSLWLLILSQVEADEEGAKKGEVAAG
jgi:hypothetical protein